MTGEPIWPIEEKPFPASKIPGEKLSADATHPVTVPEAAAEAKAMHEEDLIDFTPELRAEALKMMEKYEKGAAL